MLFWNIVLLLHELFFFIKKDNWVTRLGKKQAQVTLDEFEGKEVKESTKNELLLTGILALVYALIYFTVLGVFVYNGIKIDTYIWPSTTIILYFFISFIKSKKPKKLSDMNETELLKHKLKISEFSKRSLFGTFGSVIKISYFVYIGYILLVTT